MILTHSSPSKSRNISEIATGVKGGGGVNRPLLFKSHRDDRFGERGVSTPCDDGDVVSMRIYSHAMMAICGAWEFIHMLLKKNVLGLISFYYA